MTPSVQSNPYVQLQMDSDGEWRERGVEFKLVDEAMIPSVIELLDDSFFPDEPLFRWHSYNRDH